MFVAVAVADDAAAVVVVVVVVVVKEDGISVATAKPKATRNDSINSSNKS